MYMATMAELHGGHDIDTDSEGIDADSELIRAGFDGAVTTSDRGERAHVQRSHKLVREAQTIGDQRQERRARTKRQAGAVRLDAPAFQPSR